MATKTITGKVTGADGVGRGSVLISAVLSQATTISGTSEVPPVAVTATSASDGTYSITLEANNDLTPVNTYYTVTETRSDGLSMTYQIVVPQSAGPFVMSNLVTGLPTPGPVPASHVASLVVDGSATIGGTLSGVAANFTGALSVGGAFSIGSAGSIDISMTGADARNQVIFGAATMTGLSVGNGRGPIVGTAGSPGTLNSGSDDYNFFLNVTNYTANGAGLSIGNQGKGDGIYVQTTGTVAGTSYALNVLAGTATTPTAVGTGINVQRYGTGKGLQMVGEVGSLGDLAVLNMNVEGRTLFLNDLGAATSDSLAITAGAKTSGNIINLYQAGTTMTGSGILMNFGNSGVGGPFMTMQKAGVTVHLVDATGKQTVGSGDDVSIYNATAGSLYKATAGTAGTPDTALSGVMKVNRTLSLTAAAIGGDGGEQAAGIVANVTAPAGNQVQTVGVFGGAKNFGTAVTGSISPDACGLYGVGRILGSGVGVGIGAFFVGRAESSGAKASGGQIALYNGTGSDHTANTTGFSQTNAWWITTVGANRAGAGVEFGNPVGTQFDVGIHFNGQVAGGKTGAIATASYQDDSTAPTSLLINGTHATAAMAVKAGAGSVVIGGVGTVASPALLEVQGPAANANPLAYFGSPTNHFSYRVKIANSTGNAALFVSAGINNALIGTADGECGIASPSNAFHIGGSTSTIKVTSDNKIGLFNVAAVAQQTALGTSTGFTAGAGTAATSTSTYTGGVGSSAYTTGDIVLALKNLGALAQ